MLALTATNQSLQVVTTTASSLDYNITYIDHTSSGGTSDTSDGTISTATATTILGAPPASTQRQVRHLTLKNKGTSSNTVTLRKNISGVFREYTAAISIAVQESLWIDGDGNIVFFDVNGRPKVYDNSTRGFTGYPISFYKVGTVANAAGVQHTTALATGYPGAWAPGTPGSSGRNTNGITGADVGCLPIVNPASGANYLTQATIASSTPHMHILRDVLWVNSGMVVTTTTAQSVNSLTLPSRDLGGSFGGAGVQAGILVTAATTNAAAITNITMSYTDFPDAIAGRTATMASFPATAALGTFVPFQLAASDSGIRTIQTLTLGTSLLTGTISLCLYVDIATIPGTIANIAGQMFPSFTANPGVRLYNGTCLLPFYLASATTASNVTGTIVIETR